MPGVKNLVSLNKIQATFPVRRCGTQKVTPVGDRKTLLCDGEKAFGVARWKGIVLPAQWSRCLQFSHGAFLTICTVTVTLITGLLSQPLTCSVLSGVMGFIRPNERVPRPGSGKIWNDQDQNILRQWI